MALPARTISDIEKSNPEGLSSKQILDVFAQNGENLSEATLRKYVQLGLLPRSRRVGQKGKHRGSRGIYPVEVVRRVDEIRRAMESGETLESLARASQATRAKLGLVRVAMEETMEAAERDLQGRNLDRGARSKLKTGLADLRKSAKSWLKDLESWTHQVAAADTTEKTTRSSRGKAATPSTGRKKAATKKRSTKTKARKTKARGPKKRTARAGTKTRKTKASKTRRSRSRSS